jgi:hypothetical protein
MNGSNFGYIKGAKITVRLSLTSHRIATAYSGVGIRVATTSDITLLRADAGF